MRKYEVWHDESMDVLIIVRDDSPQYNETIVSCTHRFSNELEEECIEFVRAAGAPGYFRVF